MKNAYIEFEFKELENFLEDGMDEVQILISTNKGESLKPLSKTASGGEISRIMLALKNVFSDCAYFNFGPDLGLPGLRQYKRSFKPYTLEPKFTVKF